MSDGQSSNGDQNEIDLGDNVIEWNGDNVLVDNVIFDRKRNQEGDIEPEISPEITKESSFSLALQALPSLLLSGTGLFFAGWVFDIVQVCLFFLFFKKKKKKIIILSFFFFF